LCRRADAHNHLLASSRSAGQLCRGGAYPLVLAAGCAAVMFLHAAPAGGNDIALEAAGLATGEFACQGPEVDPLALVAHGTHGSIRRLGSALDPIGGQDAAAAA
jgi:hypothetical protein